MLFERFEVKGLAHYSYAVGCERDSVLAVIDPERDADTYVAFAQKTGAQITHVLETHIHADYASGARELADRTGAALCVSKFDAGEKYEVRFPHRDIADGETIDIGTVRLRALHTPGHTPEHMSYVVADSSARPVSYSTDRVPDSDFGPDPAMLLSGDFLFIGSLGRPDLLGEEAKRGLAGRLFDSVRTRLPALPGNIAIHPAHGAGSMCGAGMSSRSSSTLAAERVANPYLDAALTKDAFIAKILGSVPPFPPYYRRMKELNSAGARRLDLAAAVQPIPAPQFEQLSRSGHAVIDIRGPQPFGVAHIPGSLAIGAGASLAVWASWVAPYETPLLLVADNAAQAEGAARCLARVGLDDVRGHLAGGIAAWQAANLPVESTPQIQPAELHTKLQRGELRLLDVRQEPEWNGGHAPGAFHIMCGFIADHIDELRRDPRPLAVTCAGGFRSTAACSVLQRAGIAHVMNVAGGMQAWQAAGLPVV